MVCNISQQSVIDESK